MPFAFASGSLLSFSLGHPQWWSCRGGGALGRGTSMTVWHTVGVSIPSNWLTSCTTREDRKHFHKTCFPTHFVSKSCQNQSYSYFFSELVLWSLDASHPKTGSHCFTELTMIFGMYIYIYIIYTFSSNRDSFSHFTRNKLLFLLFFLTLLSETSAALHGFILISGHAGMGVAILCSHATASGRAAFGWKTGRSLLPSRSGFFGKMSLATSTFYTKSLVSSQSREVKHFIVIQFTLW